MNISSNQLHTFNNNRSEKHHSKNSMSIVFTQMKDAVLSTTSLLGLLLCLSTPAFSMEKPDTLDDLYWSKARAQKSIDEIYWSRGEENNTLTKEESNFLLFRCAIEGHPLAQIEFAENIFIKKWSLNISSKLEMKVDQDCHGTALSKEMKITHDQGGIIQGSVTQEEFIIAKEFAKSGLKGLLNPLDDNDYTLAAADLGLGGLRPYQPFSNKEFLTQEECQEIFLYWNKSYKESKKLSTYNLEFDEIVPFVLRYITTDFWRLCLYNHLGDGEFLLLVNKFLNKLDNLPDTELDDNLPWWKDPNWK